jgi:hypothetical protein
MLWELSQIADERILGRARRIDDLLARDSFVACIDH